MKVLATAREIGSEASRLIRDCKTMRCAVAWASTSCPAHALLTKHRSKVRQLSVGIHFYQTHPDFIQEFIGDESVRFVMNPDGVFHPKVYLFEGKGGNWSSIVGSPNLTGGGFASNAEVAVRIDSSDDGADKAYEDLDQVLNQYFNRGKRLSQKELAAYRAVWKRQIAKRKSLAGTYTAPEDPRQPQRPPLDTAVFTDDWQAYYAQIRSDPLKSVATRLAVLEEARRLFDTHDHFSEMPIESRKGIAGFLEKKPPEWLYFGSMKGHGYYKGSISDNSTHISRALDAIPRNGAVTRRDFDRYCSSFEKAFKHPGTATATRLLAMKRPDYFVCLDSRNERKLCAAFGITQQVKLDEYWDKVVARLADSNWWDSDEPVNDLEKRVWRGRAAFLDVLFYEPPKRKRAAATNAS